VPINTSTSMGHVPMGPTQGESSSSRMDVNGVMLWRITSIFHAPLFFAITVATPKAWSFLNLQPFYVRAEGCQWIWYQSCYQQLAWKNDFKRQLNVNPNYQHPLIGMQLMWLIWMIPLGGFKLVNNVLFYSKIYAYGNGEFDYRITPKYIIICQCIIICHHLWKWVLA
jgi:hypothetical protein